MNKLVYEMLYRIPFIPKSLIFGPLLPDLVELVESGRIAPGRAIDLGYEVERRFNEDFDIECYKCSVDCSNCLAGTAVNLMTSKGETM